MTTFFVGNPLSAEFPASNYPQLTLSNRRPVLAFDASTDETAYWTFAAPQGLSGAISCVITYAMASATSGAVYWQAQLEAITAGDATDTDATTSFDTANSGNGTVPGTAGYVQQITVTLTNKDNIAAGDYGRLSVNRDADNGSDNASGDAYLLSVELRADVTTTASSPVWMPTLTTPVLSDFAWVTQGTATATEQYGGITLYEPGHGTAASLRILKKTAPATPYVVTAAIISSMWIPNKPYDFWGLCFRQSSDGKIVAWGPMAFNTSDYAPQLYVSKWTSDTAYAAANYAQVGFNAGGILWLRIADDGANRVCSYSGDGFTWQVVHTVGRTDYMTANEVGFFVDAWNSGTPNYDVAMHLIHWAQS